MIMVNNLRKILRRAGLVSAGLASLIYTGCVTEQPGATNQQIGGAFTGLGALVPGPAGAMGSFMGAGIANYNSGNNNTSVPEIIEEQKEKPIWNVGGVFEDSNNNGVVDNGESEINYKGDRYEYILEAGKRYIIKFDHLNSQVGKVLAKITYENGNVEGIEIAQVPFTPDGVEYEITLPLYLGEEERGSRKAITIQREGQEPFNVLFKIR